MSYTCYYHVLALSLDPKRAAPVTFGVAVVTKTGVAARFLPMSDLQKRVHAVTPGAALDVRLLETWQKALLGPDRPARTRRSWMLGGGLKRDALSRLSSPYSSIQIGPPRKYACRSLEQALDDLYRRFVEPEAAG